MKILGETCPFSDFVCTTAQDMAQIFKPDFQNFSGGACIQIPLNTAVLASSPGSPPRAMLTRDL